MNTEQTQPHMFSSSSHPFTHGSSLVDYLFIFPPFYKDATSHNAFQSKIEMTFRSSVLNYLWHDFLLFEQSTSDHGKWQYYNLLSGKMLALQSFIYRYFVCVCLVFTIVVGAVGDSETLLKMALLYFSWYWMQEKINQNRQRFINCTVT